MLVDTSVWIDHFRLSNPALVAALELGDVECNDFVLGELACGTLRRRDDVLDAPTRPVALWGVPAARMASDPRKILLVDDSELTLPVVGGRPALGF